MSKDATRVFTETNKPNVIASGDMFVAATTPAIGADFAAFECVHETAEVLPIPAIRIPCEEVGSHLRQSARGHWGITTQLTGPARSGGYELSETNLRAGSGAAFGSASGSSPHKIDARQRPYNGGAMGATPRPFRRSAQSPYRSMTGVTDTPCTTTDRATVHTTRSARDRARPSGSPCPVAWVR